MKHKRTRGRTFGSLLTLALALLLVSSLGGSTGLTAGLAQETQPEGGFDPNAFTYQGQLQDAGGPLNGDCDFTFSLWDAAGSGSPPSGGTQIGTSQEKLEVTLTNGLFNVNVGFGHDSFDGGSRWLEIAVRCPAGGGLYTTLSPRQPLTPAPYALSLRPGATIHNTASIGSEESLTLESDFGDGLYVSGSGRDGVLVVADDDGVYVASAGDDGVLVLLAGNPGATNPDANSNGFEVAGAEGHGLYVGHANMGGVCVNQAGDPSATTPSADPNGLEVAGAQGHGLWVGRADMDGVIVYSAGDEGVYVDSTGGHGVEVADAGDDGVAIGSAVDDGLSVKTTGGDGVYVDTAGRDGLYIVSAGQDGMYLGSAADDGVYVVSAGDIGVYAATRLASNNYGFYTPDNLYSLNYHLAGAVMHLVQNGGSEPLEPGDVVVFSGVAAPREEGGPPVVQVARAATTNSSAVAGVVYSRLDVEALINKEQDAGQDSEVTPAGPVPPGEYLLLVVQGPAQVKASALAGAIRPGDLLSSAGQAGCAAKAGEVNLEGIQVALPGTVLGKALAPLDANQGLIYVFVTLQ